MKHFFQGCFFYDFRVTHIGLLTALSNLAQQRQDNVKDLIKESAIAHDRLILCEPEYQTQEDAIAGVEINI